MKKMEFIQEQDIPETQDYLVRGFGFPPDEAIKMCLLPSQIVAQLSQLRDVCLLFEKLYDKVERNRIEQHQKRLQLEKELEQAEAQALVATNVLEEAKARLMAKRAELETFDNEH
jgi:hypothetical protein